LQLARRYAYVYPAARLLNAVTRYAPLVEVGAGTGYWSYLLRNRGVDIVAYDLAPLGSQTGNRYHYDLWPWTEVRQGDVSIAERFPNRSLLICWPPLFSSMGNALLHYHGPNVIYVGDNGHRTAILSGLEHDFARVERYPAIAMDPAPGARPELTVWRRKPLLASTGYRLESG
jgi:hypothetical protein